MSDRFVEVGDAVIIEPVPPATELREGICRFMGTTSFADGPWIGVELLHTPGKNSGSVFNVQYFTCAPGQGLFVRPELVRRKVVAEVAAAVCSNDTAVEEERVKEEEDAAVVETTKSSAPKATPSVCAAQEEEPQRLAAALLTDVPTPAEVTQSSEPKTIDVAAAERTALPGPSVPPSSSVSVSPPPQALPLPRGPTATTTTPALALSQPSSSTILHQNRPAQIVPSNNYTSNTPSFDLALRVELEELRDVNAKLEDRLTAQAEQLENAQLDLEIAQEQILLLQSEVEEAKLRAASSSGGSNVSGGSLFGQPSPVEDPVDLLIALRRQHAQLQQSMIEKDQELAELRETVRVSAKSDDALLELTEAKLHLEEQLEQTRKILSTVHQEKEELKELVVLQEEELRQQAQTIDELSNALEQSNRSWTQRVADLQEELAKRSYVQEDYERTKAALRTLEEDTHRKLHLETPSRSAAWEADIEKAKHAQRSGTRVTWLLRNKLNAQKQMASRCVVACVTAATTTKNLRGVQESTTTKNHGIRQLLAALYTVAFTARLEALTPADYNGASHIVERRSEISAEGATAVACCDTTHCWRLSWANLLDVLFQRVAMLVETHRQQLDELEEDDHRISRLLGGEFVAFFGASSATSSPSQTPLDLHQRAVQLLHNDDPSEQDDDDHADLRSKSEKRIQEFNEVGTKIVEFWARVCAATFFAPASEVESAAVAGTSTMGREDRLLCSFLSFAGLTIPTSIPDSSSPRPLRTTATVPMVSQLMSATSSSSRSFSQFVDTVQHPLVDLQRCLSMARNRTTTTLEEHSPVEKDAATATTTTTTAQLDHLDQGVSLLYNKWNTFANKVLPILTGSRRPSEIEDEEKAKKFFAVLPEMVVVQMASHGCYQAVQAAVSLAAQSNVVGRNVATTTSPIQTEMMMSLRGWGAADASVEGEEDALTIAWKGLETLFRSLSTTCNSLMYLDAASEIVTTAARLLDAALQRIVEMPPSRSASERSLTHVVSQLLLSEVPAAAPPSAASSPKRSQENSADSAGHNNNKHDAMELEVSRLRIFFDLSKQKQRILNSNHAEEHGHVMSNDLNSREKVSGNTHTTNEEGHTPGSPMKPSSSDEQHSSLPLLERIRSLEQQLQTSADALDAAHLALYEAHNSHRALLDIKANFHVLQQNASQASAKHAEDLARVTNDYEVAITALTKRELQLQSEIRRLKSEETKKVLLPMSAEERRRFESTIRGLQWQALQSFRDRTRFPSSSCALDLSTWFQSSRKPDEKKKEDAGMLWPSSVTLQRRVQLFGSAGLCLGAAPLVAVANQRTVTAKVLGEEETEQVAGGGTSQPAELLKRAAVAENPSSSSSSSLLQRPLKTVMRFVTKADCQAARIALFAPESCRKECALN